MRISTRIFVATTMLVVFASVGYTAKTEPTVVDTLYVGYGAKGIALNPLTDTAYVAIQPSRSVAVIDMSSHTVTHTILDYPSELFPEDLTIDALTNRLYVAARESLHNPGHGVLVTIDLDDESVYDPVYIGPGRVECAGDPFSSLLYCIAAAMPGMVDFDGQKNRVLRWTPGPLCRGVAVDPIASWIYMSDQNDLASAVDTEHHERVAPVFVRGATKLAVNPLPGLAYFAQPSEDRLAIIDEVNPPQTIAVGDQPCGVAVNPITGRVYVANDGDDTLSVIAGDRVIATLDVGWLPRSVAVNPLTGLAYVANEGDGTVSIVKDAATGALPRTMLEREIVNLMVAAGAASGALQEALAFVQKGDYERAAHHLLAFIEEIESAVMLPARRAEELVFGARKIIVMMIGN